MTQKTKKGILTAGALVSAVVVVLGAMRPVARIAIVTTLGDSTYVTQQSYHEDSFRDSLTHKQETDSIFRMLRDDKQQHARTDSALRCLRRNKPGWCE